ncbi:cyclase family protein [Alteribacter natronophilus]|uniref:cyclase family protein n=1 Tax=Alteribacter natronophilus TaxID=2583810 RepID=UPI00110DE19F|nr:cyclase family protein [Alteribacter natronophilus]TMW71190.1 cyclase family protein [Alteribacter natronophilus]
MSVKTELLGDLLTGIVEEKVKIVDLTQILNEETPVIQLPPPFKNTGGFKFKKLSEYDEDGPVCYWNDFEAGEHCGTHFDAPVHWVSGKDGDSVDTMPVKNMFGEACVIDITKKVEENPDYCLSIDDIKKFEATHGEIPSHSFVIIHTGWDQYNSNSEKYFNIGEDGQPHTPGISKEASIFLVEERDILGVGVETVGTDAGIAGSFDPPFPNHHYMHQANKYGIAQLSNIDKLPPRGAVLVVNPLKIERGSGSPLRVLALIER